MVQKETIERYVSLWNKFQVSGVPLSSLETITYSEFEKKTNIHSESQFRLVKAMARKPERQKEVNAYLIAHKIPKIIIKRLPEKEIIPKVLTKRQKELKIKAQDRKKRRAIAKLVKEAKEKAEKKKKRLELNQFGVFMSMVKEVQALGYSEKTAIKEVKFLLKVPSIDYSRLQKFERDLLSDYGY